MGYHLTEPQASAPHATSYVHTGRGGAGNYQASSSASNSGSLPPPPPPPTGRFLTGRGGTGNVHAASERPMFFFDEDMERLTSRGEPAPVIHVGRGGAGNWTSINYGAAAGAAAAATATAAIATTTTSSGVMGAADSGHAHAGAGGASMSSALSARKSRESGSSVGSVMGSDDGRRSCEGGLWRRLNQTLHRV